jgi:peptidyl-prolyl cis-trans isomerase C
MESNLSHSPAARMPSPKEVETSVPRSGAAWKRIFREPLVHFLMLGAALFAISRIVKPATDRTGPSRQIVLSLDELRQIQVGFAAQWQRPPNEREMLALLENRIKEEILYREALAMGLDKDDTIVRRRMAQKMEFLAEDVSTAREPTTEELKAWFAKNTALFTQPARVTFRHLYFSPDRRGKSAWSDATAALGKLAGKPAGWAGAAAIGDPFMFQNYLADRTPEQIAKDFGPPFAKALFVEKPGAWSGPIESGYGWHVVFVDSLTPERAPSFEEIEPDVKTAWLARRKAEAWDEAYRKMRAKYELVLPAPPPAPQTPKPGKAP